MASGSVVGEGGGSEGAREKQRYSENKVYTRKAFKKNLTNLTSLNTAAAVATTVTTTTTTTTTVADATNYSDVNKEDIQSLTTPTTNTNNTAAPATTATLLTSEGGDQANDHSNHDADVGNNNQKIVEETSIQNQELQPSTVDNLNLTQQQPTSVLNATPDDSSSLNRPPVVEVTNARDAPLGDGPAEEVSDDRVKINLASKSKQEKRELRRKLESELDVVRSLVKRIEAKEVQLGVGGFSNPKILINDGVSNGLKRVTSDVGSVVVPRESTSIPTPTPRQSRPLNQLSISVLESQSIGENLEKEKRTPKANQFYRNSEFLLAKDKFPPAESNKKSKLNGKKQGRGDLAHGFGPGTKIFKSCSSLLEKLMKHKHGWVFNTPVDVKALGLHDYFSIITHPMDLGTVKSKLTKNWYKSPEEFAEDVRLTFHNALTYNPKGQDVHVMAEQLLNIFEDKWLTIKADYDREMRFALSYDVGFPTPTSRKAPPLPLPHLDMRRILDRSESMTYPHFDIRSRVISTTPSGRTPAPKKPKAKDPNKRDMTYEEKQKLSTNLQSLPSEKLDNIVQIIKKRNSALFQHDDEIEVDIDSVDAETLWELDRFVTNYKKSLSKKKRKAELAMQARAEAAQNVQEKTLAAVVADTAKQNKTDERNVSTSSPVQDGKEGDDGSRSSSSSSSSSDSGSSSSDTDSDSSSASGSDVGN